MSVTANPGGLTPGTYNGTIRLTATGASNSPIDVPVTLRVTNDPLLRVSPSSVVFTYQTNGPLPASRPIVVANAAGTAVPVSVTTSTSQGGLWLSAVPASASTPLAVVVSANPAGLLPGLYNGSVTITGTAANSPLTVQVALVVTTAPAVRLSESQLNFTYTTNSVLPPPQTVAVSSTGAATNFAAATIAGVTWLSATPPPAPHQALSPSA
ncbi:MAG: hypothetical protein R2762_00165 [Bryobacteraceae bacterium]